VLRPTFSPELLGALLNHYGFEDVGGDRRGEIPFGDSGDRVPMLYVYGKKK
jgi:hypothetical protein